MNTSKLMTLAGVSINAATLALTWYTFSTYGEHVSWVAWVPIPMVIISTGFLIRYYIGRKNAVRS